MPRDASSSAIVASGLIELATFTGAPDSARYLDAAVSLIEGLWASKYRGLNTQASILNHSTGSRKEGHDVDMGIIYADYYFLEALLRYEKLEPSTAVARHRTRTPPKISDAVSSSGRFRSEPEQPGYIRIIDIVNCCRYGDGPAETNRRVVCRLSAYFHTT